MTLPSAGEMAAMRAVVQSVMPDTATILRNVPVDDGQGGARSAWGSIGTTPCELVPNPGKNRGEVDEAGKTVSIPIWLVRVPVGTDVLAKDRLSIGGRSFDVLDRDTGRSTPLSIVLDCRSVE